MSPIAEAAMPDTKSQAQTSYGSFRRGVRAVLLGPPGLRGFFGFMISWNLLDFPGFLQLFGLLVFFNS